MAKMSEGTGNYGVEVKYSGGGTTTFWFTDDTKRSTAFARIKTEVTKRDKVKKKNR